MQLDEFLQQLWLTTNESQMYLALLACNTSPASLVAKKCNIDRSNSYKLLESLIQKGFVSMSLKWWTKYYTPLDPQSLHYKIQQLQNNFEQFLPQLQELIPAHSHVLETQYYEWIEGFRSMWYSNLEKRRASMKLHDNTWWWYQDHLIVDIIRTELQEYWTSRLEKWDEYVCLLSNDSVSEQELNIANRHIKFLKDSSLFEWNTLWVCGDYSIVITQIGAKITSQHIYNPSFSKSMRILSQYIWHTI